MKCFIICCSLALCITSALAVTISTPGMQRRFLRESCMFQWNVDGYFTTYTIQRLSTGSTTALGPNTNHSFDSRKSVVILLIWNIQVADAGHYSLSVSTGPSSTKVNTAGLLFVYNNVNPFLKLAVGRNPAFEGDTIELNCSANSNSMPADFRPKLYYYWYSSLHGYFRNISSGPAVLQNGIVLSGYSVKYGGKTFVIASAQSTDNYFACYCQEEGSPYRNGYGLYLQVYSKPYTYNFIPANKKFNAPLSSSIYCYLSFRANPPLTSYTNWSLINGSGYTTELPLTISSMNSGTIYLNFALLSLNSYGNYSVTLTNSNGSRTETFQVLPTGPPEVPSNFSLQYVTHSLVSLLWHCMWFNGADQSVFVRLMDARGDIEVETQILSPEASCYNLPYSTLFHKNIQPETDYQASIWSINTLGSSNIVNLAVKTPKRLIFDTSPANISIMGSEATITFSIADSSKAILRLNVTCCAELTTLCSNKSYIMANTDNEIVYDILPAGTEYVFDFNVYDTDGYTYIYTLAIVKGVRVSRMQVYTDSTTDKLNTTTPISDAGKENPTTVAVIVLAILLSLAVSGLIGCLIAFLVYNCRQKPKPHNPNEQPPTRPSNRKGIDATNAYERDSSYELPTNSSADNGYYTSLDVLPQDAKN